jgi:hypothetical protein
LNTWFQPEHHRGAWLRSLSNGRPEVAALVRQRLTDVRLPEGACRLEPPRWVWLLAYTAAVATAAIGFRALPLPVIYQIRGTLLMSLFLLAVAVTVWRKECQRRRLQVVTAIRKALETEGARLAAILEGRD